MGELPRLFAYGKRERRDFSAVTQPGARSASNDRERPFQKTKTSELRTMRHRCATAAYETAQRDEALAREWFDTVKLIEAELSTRTDDE
jgi:hypothetical protein